jgi:hypothetical protein
MPTCSPIYDPGEAFTGRATGAAVTGCRVVCVAASKSITANAGANELPIKHCGATDKPIGVSAQDAVQNDICAIYPPGIVLPILVGGTGATAGAAAEVMATGVVQDLASGTKVGVFLTTTPAAGFALVQLQF